MAEVGNIFVRIGAKIDDFEAAMRQVQESIKSVESRFSGLTKIGQELSGIGARVAAAGAAMGAGLGFAVKTAADFEAQMSKVKALSGATEEDFKRLRDAAIELGAQSVYSASEAAQGMQILAAAGFDTNQIIAAMPGLLNAAAAAGEDFATVADIMVAAMSGFGLQASDMAHIADVLASAANASAISITDIGYSLKYIAPVAKTAGVSLEEVSAALAILGNAGIKAEQAGTTLRMALIRLADPPKEAAAMLEQLGIKITDASGKMLPFQQIIAQLHEKFQGLSQAQRIQAAATIFGAEAMSGMLALIEAGPEKLAELTTQFQNSSGAAQQMAETMTNNLAGAVEQLKGALESALIAIGTALTPAIQAIVQHLQALVEWFNNLPEPVQRGIALFAALAGGITLVGGTMLTLVGIMMQGIAGIGMLVAKLSALPVAFTSLVAPIGIAIAGITAFGIAAYEIYKHWDGIKEFFATLWEGIKTTVINAANAVLDFLRQWGPLILAAVTGPIGLLVYAIATNWERIKQTTATVWDAIKNAVVAAFEWMYNHNYYFQYLADFIKQVWQTIMEFSISIWNGIKDTLAGIWEAIKTVVTTTWQAIQDVTIAIWTAISQRLLALWQQIRTQAVAAWNSIYGVISDIWNRLKQGFDSLVNAAWNWGRNLLSNFIGGIRAMLSELWDTLSNVASTVAGFLGFHSPTKLGPGREADKWAPNFIEMFAQGLRAGIPKLEATLQDLALTLNPAVAAAGNVSNITYGGHTIIINVSGGSTSEIAEELLRELARRGVRF